MLYRFLFLFSFFCYSQQNDQYHIINFNLPNYIEINNIGDPLLYLTPNFSNNFFLNHISKNVRKVDEINHRNLNISNNIYSDLFYQSSYNEGALLQTILSRPIGATTFLNFNYNNFSSKGFYNHQKNKYSRLHLSLDLFKNKKYSLFLSLLSLNAEYEQYGGLSAYSTSIALDLMETNSLSAVSFIRNREVKLHQKYRFNSLIRFEHNCTIGNFERNYIDPIYPPTIDNDTLKTFFNTLFNRLSILNKNFQLSVHHHYYNTNDISLHRMGDVIISLENTSAFKTNKNVAFNMSFCPVGYNQNNYLVNVNLFKETQHSKYVLSFHFSDKKPDFFRLNPLDQNYRGWNSFLSVNTIFLNLKSIWNTRNIITEFSCNRYANYMYFNELAYPTQATQTIAYFNFRLQKKWYFNNLSIQSALSAQHFNTELLSLPKILYHQKIQYNMNLFEDVIFNASLNSYLFSNYYPNAFLPLMDVFYHQFETKSKITPFTSFDLFLSKERFRIGFIVDNINSFFMKENYFVPSYFLPNTTVRMSLKWTFLD